MPTIVPVVSESRWLEFLSPLPQWEVPLTPTLILAPHPDDETLGAGGMIVKLRRQGVPVTIVAVTNGESSYADTPALGATRTAEQTEALGRLGVSESMVHRFQLPDRNVADHEKELAERILPLLAEGMHVVAPWARDFHPDHEATGRAAAHVAQETGLILTYYLFWTWHRGTPDLLQEIPLFQLPLTPAELEAKLYALQAHISQFDHPFEEPILTSELLAPARRPFEVYIQ